MQMWSHFPDVDVDICPWNRKNNEETSCNLQLIKCHNASCLNQ